MPLFGNAFHIDAFEKDGRSFLLIFYVHDCPIEQGNFYFLVENEKEIGDSDEYLMALDAYHHSIDPVAKKKIDLFEFLIF